MRKRDANRMPVRGAQRSGAEHGLREFILAIRVHPPADVSTLADSSHQGSFNWGTHHYRDRFRLNENRQGDSRPINSETYLRGALASMQCPRSVSVAVAILESVLRSEKRIRRTDGRR